MVPEAPLEKLEVMCFVFKTCSCVPCSVVVHSICRVCYLSNIKLV